jgi:DNA-binding transcriptional regulator YdaS (Cro superfamily)
MVRELIQRLGGPGDVARRLGLTAAAVSQWSSADRIPPARLIALWKLARERQIDWTPPGCAELTGQKVTSIEATMADTSSLADEQAAWQWPPRPIPTASHGKHVQPITRAVERSRLKPAKPVAGGIGDPARPVDQDPTETGRRVA